MRKSHTIFLLAVMIMIWFIGCFSSPEKHYFQLYLTPSTGAEDIIFDQVLLVETVKADDLYDDYRIIYRVSPYQMNYYSYDFWADKPSVIIRDSLIHFLTEGNFFKKVTKEYSTAAPDLIFRTRLHFLEEVDQETQWYARLSMALEIIDFESGEIIAAHRFDRMEKMGYKQVSEVPRVVSRILKQELEIFLKDLKLEETIACE